MEFRFSSIFAVVLTVVLCAVSGQDTTICTTTGGKASGEGNEFPDIFTIAVGLSYQSRVVVSYENLRQTSYFTEYYDIANKRGRLDKVVEGERQTFLYYFESKEAFTIKDGICTLYDVKDVPPFEADMTWGWVDYETEHGVLGPSAILRQAYTNSTGVFLMPEKEEVRGMAAVNWRKCFLDGKLTVDYYFSDPQWGEPYGFKGPIPLRVRVSGYSEEEGDALPQTYEFVAFQPYISNEQDLEIPNGYGCERFDRSRWPPKFDKDFDVYGEVVFVYRDVKEDSASSFWKYVNNFRVTFDHRSTHLSYEYTPWRQTTGAKDIKKIDLPVYEVYDMLHNVSYKYDEETSCDIRRFSKAEPHITLPAKAGNPIDLLDPVLFRDSYGFEYLGTNTVRGYPVDVYERVLNDTKKGSVEDSKNFRVIYTRSYLREDTYYADGAKTENAPVQIKIVYLDSVTKKMSHVITINAYAFTTHVENKPYRFDVRPCFSASGSRFIITFTGAMDDIEKAKRTEPEIIEETLSNLYLKGISPVRVQDVWVYFDKIHAYASALLLDRPHYSIDFVELGTYKFVTDTTETTDSSEEACALRCLENFDSCRGYSFCSGKCITTTSPDAAKQRTRGCSSRLRNSYLPPIPTLSTVKKELSILVRTNQLTVAITNPDNPTGEPIFLPATDVKFIGEEYN